MMKTIFKYQLKVTDAQLLFLPKGAEILTVQVQNNIPCLWALIDPNEIAKEQHYIETYGTGTPINIEAEKRYIATYQLAGGMLVWHVFENTTMFASTSF